MDTSEISALIRSEDDVVMSDAFDDAEIVGATASAHRHAFAPGDVDELTRLFHAHRTAPRIVVVARVQGELAAPCAAVSAILVPLQA